jgi:hypothetical protein
MGKTYSAPIDIADAGTDNDQDIFTIAIPNGKKCQILSFEIFSNTIAAAALELELVQRSGLGTGGTAVVEEDHDRDEDAVSDCTVTTDTETPGTETASIRKYHWEQLGPLEYKPIPEERIMFDESTWVGLHLETSPVNAAITGTVTWEEF